MTMRTLTAMFDSYERGAEAVRQLEAAGVSHSDVSIVSNDASHQKYHGDDAAAGATGTGAGTGASLGTVIGGGAGLLAGLGMLAIPGLGPVVAAGWLVSTLVGAGVGAAAGGVVGGLTGAGVSERDAHVYAEGVRRGGTLVTARVDDTMLDQATQILDRDGTIDMDERENTWRKDGWTGSYAGTDATLGSAGSPPVGNASILPGAPRTTGIGGMASQIDETVGGTAGRVAQAAERDVGRLGQRVGTDNATPGTGPLSPDANSIDPGARSPGATSGRNRVRIYDQP